jgi:hypothetical protein
MNASLPSPGRDEGDGVLSYQSREVGEGNLRARMWGGLSLLFGVGTWGLVFFLPEVLGVIDRRVIALTPGRALDRVITVAFIGASVVSFGLGILAIVQNLRQRQSGAFTMGLLGIGMGMLLVAAIVIFS